MINWHSIPLARMAIPIMSGIVLAYLIPISTQCLFYGIAAFLAAYKLFDYFRFLSLKQSGYFKTACLYLTCLALGVLAFNLKCRQLPENHFSKENSGHFLIQITEIKKQDDKRLTCISEVLLAIGNNEKRTVSGKIYVRINANCQKLEPGDILIVPSCYKVIEPRRYPWEFDFKKYMAMQSIGHQMRLNDHQFKVMPHENMGITRLAHKIKRHCLLTLRTYLKDSAVYGLAEGLTIGYKYDISQDIMTSFSNSGTLHLLASSGMHVGLIYWILGLIFMPLKNVRHGALIQFIAVTIFLWMYAFVSGLGPSIVRATVIFNLAGIGTLIGRKADSINLLFATSIIQMIQDPWSIFNIGFQLSYAAVLGILTLHPILNKSWESKFRLVNYIKEMSSISISAQLFTMPLTIYYFGTFPLLFLFANLVLIPISTVLLYAILALLAISWFEPAAVGLSWVIEKITLAMLYLSDLCGFPESVIRHIDINLFVAVLMACLILTITSAIHFKSKTSAFISMIICFLFTLSIKAHRFKYQEETFIYKIRYLGAIVCIRGENALLVYDKESQKGEEGIFKLHNSLKYMKEIKEIIEIDIKKKLVSTNFAIYPGIGLQFFDKIMTLK